MKLNINNLNNKSFWENANIEIPKYDIKKLETIRKKIPLGFILEREIYSEVFWREYLTVY